MSLIRTLRVTLPPSQSQDVVGHRLRIAATPGWPDYNTPFVELGPEPTNVNLAELPGFSGLDGRYNMAFSAVDDAGNESDFVVVEDMPLDFLAPLPPGTPEFSE